MMCREWVATAAAAGAQAAAGDEGEAWCSRGMTLFFAASGQGCGDEVGVVQEADLSAPPHPSGHQALVIDLLGCSLPMSRTGMINIGGSLHAQRFVRPDLVKLPAPDVQRRLPFEVVGPLDLVADVEVQAFVMAVVAGTRGSSPQQVDAQSHLPSRQTREAQESAHAGKRNTVGTADSRGQAVLGKERLEAGANRLGFGIGQGPCCQNLTAVLVAHGQSLAASFGIMPPTFEVHRPDVMAGRGHRMTAELPTQTGPALAPLVRQPAALQHALVLHMSRTTSVTYVLNLRRRAKPALPSIHSSGSFGSRVLFVRPFSESNEQLPIEGSSLLLSCYYQLVMEFLD